jgi:hypothetical protein
MPFNDNSGMRHIDHSAYAPLTPFLQTVWLGDIAAIRQFLDDSNKPHLPRLILPEVDIRTGMNALHLAVGRNNLEMARMLVEAGVKAIPDKEGRMPSLIAAELGVSDELADFIFDVESRDLKVEALQGV